MGHQDEPFYLADKENQCVVCGNRDELTSHHCVPYCFRKWFPLILKKYASHDNLIVCETCHHAYEQEAWKLKQQLFAKYMDADDKKRLAHYNQIVDHGIAAAIAIARHGANIPKPRMDVLYDRVRKHLGKDDITMEDILALVPEKKHRPKIGRCLIGECVVNKLTDLKEFIKMWREHFLKTMCPQFMPPHWDVNHRM